MINTLNHSITYIFTSLVLYKGNCRMKCSWMLCKSYWSILFAIITRKSVHSLQESVTWKKHDHCINTNKVLLGYMCNIHLHSAFTSRSLSVSLQVERALDPILLRSILSTSSIVWFTKATSYNTGLAV